jgi:hypothetical protein
MSGFCLLTRTIVSWFAERTCSVNAIWKGIDQLFFEPKLSSLLSRTNSLISGYFESIWLRTIISPVEESSSSLYNLKPFPWWVDFKYWFHQQQLRF